MNSSAMQVSLVGLSVGDAFGAMLDGFGADLRRRAAKRLISMQRPWRWTDDTAMARSVVDVIRAHGMVDPDALALAFVRAFEREPGRGYGAGAFDLLTRVSRGGDWRTEAAGLFHGAGSFGNGAAMRAAPIGGAFADDLARVRIEAARSAAPTHTHPEGIAGAIAVATAAALATRGIAREDLLRGVIEATPPGQTRTRLLRARELGLGFDVQLAGEELGTGANVTAQDTVPFSIWIAARHLDSYEEALWTATAHPGLELATNALALSAIDRDTVGAIVGGIVACACGLDGIPLLWREATEPL